MNYVLINVSIRDDSILEKELTENIFKTLAYSAKFKDKKTKTVDFDYVLVPINEYPISESDDVKGFITSHTNCTYDKDITDINVRLAYETLYTLFSPVIDKKFTFNVVMYLTDESFSVFYSDGSSSPKTKSAGYASIFLKEKVDELSKTKDDVYDELTDAYYSVEINYGKVDVGTNNIGELTGVKKSIESATDKQVQVLVSDSEYSLKCFREWIHNWKANGYKGSNKKPILNCDLIKSIQELIEKSGKIYLFRWTKGHNDNALNDLCDLYAKTAIGIN